MEETLKKEKRIEYLDLLRIIAIIGVIVIHVTTREITENNIENLKINLLFLFDGFVRWCVPIFIMISGTLLLSKDYSLKELYFKKILRIITAFIFWSIIYVVFLDDKFINELVIRKLLVGNYHMWFLLMIIGLYILTPLFKKIVESETLTKYFLTIWIVISLLLPTIYDVILLMTENSYIVTAINAFKYNLNKLEIALSYSGYFVLGYYLYKKNFSKKSRIGIYILGIIGAVLTTILTMIVSKKVGKYSDIYSQYLTLNVFLESVAVYVFAKYHFKTNKVFKNVAKCCFGIYLVHVLVLEKGESILGINALSFNPILSVPLITISVFLIALLISEILNKIPILKKYIV